MLRKIALSLLISALALLASAGLAPPVTSAPITVWVDDDPAGTSTCVPPGTSYRPTISLALTDVIAGDTIRVCEGDYWETHITVPSALDRLTITGPGATPGEDGVATVHLSDFTWLLGVFADDVVVQGLDLDVAPVTPGDLTRAIDVSANGVRVQRNHVRNATGQAVNAFGEVTNLADIEILDNTIWDSQNGVHCECDGSTIAGNTVSGVTGWAIDVVGTSTDIAGNTVANGGFAGIVITGIGISVTDNTLTDYSGLNWGEPGLGMWFRAGPDGGSATITRNTFERIANPIYIDSSSPVLPMAVTVAGSEANANTFIDSGGTLYDPNYLLTLHNIADDINAQYNRWGLCTADEIEQEIFHQPDDANQGLVDFEPFIEPDDCPEPATPTPTTTPTPTPTPGPTATPTPGDMREVTIPPGSWANFAWTGESLPQTVADCFGAGNVAVMYRLDAATGSFQRWVRGRDDLSNMGEVLRYDALLALNGSALPATCTMPDQLSPHSLTIPAGRWANLAWLAGVSSPAAEVAEVCGEGAIAVLYRLDAATQTFQRWVRGRDDLSNMGEVLRYDALLALNAGDQPATCTMSP